MVRHTGEDFIDVESVAIAAVFSFQSSSVYSAEFDAPEADSFSADENSSFCEEVFNITVAVTTRLRLNL